MHPSARLVIASALLGLSAGADAFDGDRRGLLVGLSIGTQSTDAEIEAEVDLGDPDVFGFPGGTESLRATEDGSGGAFALRIGAGVGRHGALYFLHQTNLDSGDVKADYALTGVGGTYYFRDSGPSFYLHGGLGLGTISFDDGSDDFEGTAAMVGAGYSPLPGLHLDLNVMRVQASDDMEAEAFSEDDDTVVLRPAMDIEFEFNAVQLMIGYTWY